MLIFIISFFIIFLAMVGMGIGLVFGKACPRGSCHGLGKLLGGEGSCEFCIKKNGQDLEDLQEK